MTEPRQWVVPMIAYQDGLAALDWLAKAFGFVERARHLAADGTLGHGEMFAGEGLIMLATPTPEYEGPRAHRLHCERAKAWSRVPWIIDGVLVHVDNLDTHHARAKVAGAHILSEPAEGPAGRMYRAEDLEGHRWMFLQLPRSAEAA